MTRILIESLFRFSVVIPLIFIFLKKHIKENYYRILIFTLCFIVYQLVLVLPKMFKTFNFIHSIWNWDGKILGIVFGIFCYFTFKKYFSENNFFTFKQDKDNFRKAAIASLIFVILATIIWSLFGKSDFNIETLAFQLTVPGIDEEIMYHGILLGLLMSGLKEKIGFIGNPGILIIAILFGLRHALTFNINYSINFEPVYFIQTGFTGYFLGWVTIKSRSILLAIFSHNFYNFFGTLVTMIK